MPPFFWFLFIVAGLNPSVLVANAQTRPADLVIVNAKIRTLVSRDSVTEALAVTAGRITAVGRNATVRKLIGPSTRVIDASGRLVLPGFNDAHVHFMGIGNSFSSIDLRDAKTSEEIVHRIAHYVRFLPKGRWILGSTWPEIGRPERLVIDRIAPDNPVFIYRPDGKSAFASSLAQKLAGLMLGSDASGLVTGPSMQAVASVVPRDHISNRREIAETATNYAASLGVTSVQDMHSDDGRSIYRELGRQGMLKTRVYDCIALPDWKKLDESLTSGDAMVRGGCLKSFSEGDQESGPRLLGGTLPADKAGFQIMVHAIGNSANDIVLGVFEQMVKTNGTRDRRLRIEHAHNPRPTDLGRFSRSGIVASMQPHLFTGAPGGFYSSLLRLNTSIAFGSDAAITDFNPLLGIHAAINAGNESISVYEAVRAYTIGSAYAEFQEKEKGTIEPGKLADFVILSDDIFSVVPMKVRDARVVLTVVDGRVVYARTNYYEQDHTATFLCPCSSFQRCGPDRTEQ